MIDQQLPRFGVNRDPTLPQQEVELNGIGPAVRIAETKPNGTHETGDVRFEKRSRIQVIAHMQKEASRQGISLGLFQYRMVLLQRTIDRGPLPVPVDPVWADGMRDFMKERVIEEAAESQLLVVQRCLKQPLVNLPIHEV